MVLTDLTKDFSKSCPLTLVTVGMAFLRTLSEVESSLQLVAVVLRLCSTGHADLLSSAVAITGFNRVAAALACEEVLEGCLVRLEEPSDIVPEGRGKLGGGVSDGGSEERAISLLGGIVLGPGELVGCNVCGVIDKVENTVCNWINGVDTECRRARRRSHGRGNVRHGNCSISVSVGVIGV